MTRRSPQLRIKKGFTIVELLIVIVVIGILAGIVIVSYSGWHTNVITSQIKSDLNGASSAMESAKTFSTGYPTSGTLPINITSVLTSFTPSSGDTLLLSAGSTGTAYCIDATNSSEASVVYYIDNATKSPTAGTCASRVPVAPSGLLASSVSTSSITVSWSGVPNAVSYTVQASTDNSFPPTPLSSTVSGLTTTFSGLTAGTQYYFRVLSTTSSGTPGAWSSTAIGATLPSGLVGWWPLDGNANDMSGNGNNGTVLGATLTNGQNGQANGAYSFNGTSNQITMPDSSSLDQTGAMTISAWVNFNSLGTWQGIVTKEVSGSVNNPPYSLEIRATNQLDFNINNPSNSAIAIGTVPITPATGTWYYLVGVYDGSNVTVYINGAGRTLSTTITNIANTSGPFRIGQQINARSDWLNGIVDDVRIYNTALSSSVVQATYNAGAQ